MATPAETPREFADCDTDDITLLVENLRKNALGQTAVGNFRQAESGFRQAKELAYTDLFTRAKVLLNKAQMHKKKGEFWQAELDADEAFGLLIQLKPNRLVRRLAESTLELSDRAAKARLDLPPWPGSDRIEILKPDETSQH